MNDPEKPDHAPSPVEGIKEDSRGLRGTIGETIAAGKTHFEEADYQLLKFHGSYQQDDRDLRAERKRAGLEKAWSYMVRSKVPGGDLTAEQYLAHDRIADEIGNGTVRITTREAFQVHGVILGNLKACIQKIKAAGLTTWGTCGDVVRNTVGPSSPLDTPAHRDAHVLAHAIGSVFLPTSRAYIDLWLDGEKVDLDLPSKPENDPVEPIYGRHYLPRKFKIGIAIPPCNDVDVYTQDVGLVPHLVGDRVEGYTVLVGGGFGMSHGTVQTYPRLADPLFYVRREQVIDAVVAIVTAQRDFGDRTNRKHARLKYLIEERGLEWFRGEVLSRLGVEVEPPKPLTWESVSDHLGWHPQGDGRYFVGIQVPQGRIVDVGPAAYRTAFREVAETFGYPVRLTANCNLLFYEIPEEKRDAVQAVLDRHGVPRAETLTLARRMAHACVALPTCGLALAESERVFAALMDAVDERLRRLGMEEEQILVRMTGCPNGCARPYNADFAFVGRAPGKYAMYVGGSARGDRLAGLYLKTVTFEEIPERIGGLLSEFSAHRNSGERFADYWGRTRPAGERPMPEQFHVELEERAARMKAGG
jgi:sulfite reductase beta subunit-like hemoprotein